MVTDSEMVRETILLPEAGPGALKVFRCGVTNCGVTFTAQAEVVLCWQDRPAKRARMNRKRHFV